MANVKITELTELAAIDVADNDVLPIVDVGGDTTKKITAASLKTSIAYANDFITYTQLNSNIDSVQSNVVAAEANIAGTDARLVANVAALNDVDSAINIRITNNTAVAASNDFITYTQLNSNINVVQDNVAAIDANVVSISDTGGHTVNFSANLIPSTNAVYDLGSATAQWKDLYLTGSTIKLGGITISELAGEGITITGTSGEQANLTTPSLGGVANISAEIEGIDARIAANTLVAASNDFATYTRLQANIDLVQDNVASVTVGTAADTETRLNANLDITNDNVTTLTTTVDNFGTSSNANAAALAADIAGISVDTAAGTEARLNANLDITNDNVTSLTTTVDNFGTYANSTLDTKANVSATLFLARANDFATYTRLQANIDLVQDNVASVTVGTAADTETRLNANLDITNDNVSTLTTTVDNFGTSSNANATALALEDTALQARIAANALVAASNDYVTFTRLNANVNVVQDNVATLTTTVDNFGTSSNANATALALEDVALQSRLGTNVTALTNEDTALQSRLATNVTALTNEDIALQSRLTSNVDTLTVNINTLDANADAIEARRAANLVSAVFTSDVTISGNLIVTGAQVDLGVQTATIQNNFIELSAELAPGDTPATDSGLLINRGNKGNVFIGDHLGEDGVIFVRTQTPDTNTVIAIESFMDLHGNNFHAAADVNLQRVHFGLRDSEDTGIIIDDAGANINFVVGGSYVANVHYDGTLNSQNAIIAPKVFAGGVELQANDSATLFSARANDFATYTLINANVDVVQDNVATLTTTVDNFGTSSNSNAAALAAEDVALQARITSNAATAASNDFVTYTQLNSNVNVVQDNVAQNATDISAVEARRAANIAGAVSTITTGNLTASRALVSDGSGKVGVSDVTSTELGYLDGVTSAIQTQLNAKQATITGAATTIDDTNLTATRALVSDGSGKVSVSTVSSTELGYVEGVTSAIQTQLDSKLASASYTAADVLTKIKTVDGTGSGLDADLLDGQSAAYYAVEATRASNAADLAAGIAAVPTGDITAVTAGSGLTGGGSSGSVTLNVGAGTGVSVAADTVSIGQAIGTGDSPTFAGLTVDGTFDLGTL